MRLHRLIAILLLLESRGCLKAKDLADALETSKRTIHRDIDFLCESGVPITSISGPLGGYSLVDGYTLNLKSMHCDEIVNLYLSGMGLHPNEYSEASLALKNAILKLEKTVPSNYIDDIKKAKERFYFDPDSWWEDKPDLHYLDILRKAILLSKKLKLIYTTSSMGKLETKTRIIQPYGLVVKNSEWYLVAFCESKNDLRVFKCVRILEVSILEDTFLIPTDFDLESFWKKWKSNFKQILSQVPYFPVTLRLLSISKDMLTNVEIIEETVKENKSLLLVNLYTFANACNKIIDLGKTVEVIAPLELREFVIENTKEQLKIYYPQ